MAGILDVFKGKTDERSNGQRVEASMSGEVSGSRPGSSSTPAKKASGATQLDSPAAS